jgi:hypothetical protein
MLATAEARLDRDMPMPIPPCIMGTLIFKSPILSAFIVMALFE